MAISKISKETLEKIKKKSILATPNNPSERGMTPEAIKRTLTAPMFDENDSFVGEVNRIINEINTAYFPDGEQEVQIKHNKLQGLDYESSGHTGFASSNDLNKANAEIRNLQLNKQDKLVNQQNIKSIDNETLLGSGNIDLEKKYRKISDSMSLRETEDGIRLALGNIEELRGVVLAGFDERPPLEYVESLISHDIDVAISNLINNSPDALNTLQELAKALDDNPNFATDIANALGLKATKIEVNHLKSSLEQAIEKNLSKITNLETTVNQNKTDINQKVDDNYDTLDGKINNEITTIGNRVSVNESNISKNASDINTLNSGLSSANNNINKKLDKAQGTTQANKVAITNSNGDVTFVEKIPSANLPDTGVSVDTAKNVESSSGRIITGAEIEAVIDDTTKDINAKVDCYHRYEITGATNDEHNLAIEDQQMLINKISGRTLVRNQLVNPNLAPPKTLNGLTLVNNGDGSFTFSGSHTISGQTFFNIVKPLNLIVGHKYCLMGSHKDGGVSSYGIYISQTTVGKYYGDFGNGVIFENTTSDSGDLSIFVQGEGAKNLTFKPQLIDLTLAYGVGKEPTKVEEFLNDFPEYIPYDEGTFVHSNNKLISTGKNLWKYGDVSGTQYVEVALDTPIKAGRYTISAFVESTDTDNTISVVNYSDKDNKAFAETIYNRNEILSRTITFIKDVYFVKFYASDTWNNGAGDKFSFKNYQIEYGEVATDYKPYKEEVIEGISELKVYDYIDNLNNKIILANKLVDLGTLEWKFINDVGFFYTGSLKDREYGAENITIFGSKYSNKSVYQQDNTIYGNSSGRELYLKDTSFNGDAVALTQSLNGVMLAYELAEPTITESNLPAGMSVYKGGYQIQEGTIPYNIEKQYALSIASQVKQNIEIDREQQEQINNLKNDIENINFDGYTKEESDNKYAFKTTVSDITSQLSNLNVNKLNAEQVQEKINQSISNLINSAPENLDTLGEIAQALKENDDVANALAMSIGQKIDKPLNGKTIFQLGASNLLFEGKLEKGLYRIEFSGVKSVQNVVYVDFTYNDTVVCPINYLDYDVLVQIGYFSFNLTQEDGSLKTLFNVYGDDALRVPVELPHITLIFEKII